MKLINIVSGPHLFNEFIEAGQRPSVQLGHIFRGNLFVGVKIKEVAQHIAGGIADLKISVGKLFHDFLGNPHILLVVCG
ncbi:hypothetical protein SDC9_69515 [bioreactor metagenome]|uniref:Uncharacterized protein n=1 Tax=bioreactor metagenome TaxID=1076179 RepID=A0A644Y3C5_9ZZZZ